VADINPLFWSATLIAKLKRLKKVCANLTMYKYRVLTEQAKTNIQCARPIPGVIVEWSPPKMSLREGVEFHTDNRCSVIYVSLIYVLCFPNICASPNSFQMSHSLIKFQTFYFIFLLWLVYCLHPPLCSKSQCADHSCQMPSTQISWF